MGPSAEEIAFYDALAQNESARDVMGEPALRVIAHELVQVIKSNVWMHRTSARANIRRHVKRLLRLPARPSGRCSSERPAVSGGALLGMGCGVAKAAAHQHRLLSRYCARQPIVERQQSAES
jgi:hypothetical protein